MNYYVFLEYCINDFGEKEITHIRITDPNSASVYESEIRPLYPTEEQKETLDKSIPYFYEEAPAIVLILQGKSAKSNHRKLLEEALAKTAFHIEAEEIWWLD